MGRELQKKKRRSGRAKVTRKPKSKKMIFGNSVVAEHWDRNHTLSQNYEALGLVSKLNHRAGGTEKQSKNNNSNNNSNSSSSNRKDVVTGSNISKRAAVAAAAAATTEVRVERDPQTGAIVTVLDEQKVKKPNPLNDPLNDLSDSDEDVADYGVTRTAAVAELELMAQNEVKASPRRQSTREEEWIERLVEKHGNDYGKMFRDKKLNPMQQSEGDIRRRVNKWLRKREQG